MGDWSCSLQARKEVAAFKKAAPKFLLIWVMGVVADNAMTQINKVFLLLFVHKK
jgi:hypothetical protein